MATCKNCGIIILDEEKINFLGYCNVCFPQKRRTLKMRLIYIVLLGLFFISFGIIGPFVIVQDLMVGFSMISTSEELAEFVAVLIFSIIFIPIMVFLAMYGIFLLRGGIKGFKKLRISKLSNFGS